MSRPALDRPRPRSRRSAAARQRPTAADRVDRRLDRHPHAAARRPVLRDQGRHHTTATTMSRAAFDNGRGRGRRRRGACRRPARRTARSTSSHDTLRAHGAARRAPRAPAPRRASSRSPARSARPARRRRCASSCPRTAPTHASAASYNNHWGVPLTLARMPADARFRRLRDRHEPCRRDHAAGRHGAAACRDHHRRSRRCISSISARSRRSPTPRPRSSPASSPAASRSQPRRAAVRAAARARRGAPAGTSSTFGEHEARRAARRPSRLAATARASTADVPRRAASTSGSARPAGTWRMNALAVLLAAQALGAPTRRRAAALGGLRAARAAASASRCERRAAPSR